ncbi:hypothetical protein GWK47_001918 [Chionoecetes opilio]|uniref:Uncharacterized protein n=1 Tax=Chionoecetes opilio TaxID=41210 RepID=A0A8J4XS73_CHIOP|nr:hypothetical protein GWK47_001918 [Chionoecetes opilio]
MRRTSVGLPILRRPAGFRRVVRGGAQTPHQHQGLFGSSSLPPIEPDPRGDGSLASRWTTGRGPLSRPAKGHPICPSVAPFPEQIFGLAAVSTFIRLPGSCREWRMCGPNALSRFRGSSVGGSFARTLCGSVGVGHSGDGPLRVPPPLPNYRPF